MEGFAQTTARATVDTAQELADEAHRLIDAGDVVLVKGSKGSRVSLVVDTLRKVGRVLDLQKGNS